MADVSVERYSYRTVNFFHFLVRRGGRGMTLFLWELANAVVCVRLFCRLTPDDVDLKVLLMCVES